MSEICGAKWGHQRQSGDRLWRFPLLVGGSRHRHFGLSFSITKPPVAPLRASFPAILHSFPVQGCKNRKWISSTGVPVEIRIQPSPLNISITSPNPADETHSLQAAKSRRWRGSFIAIYLKDLFLLFFFVKYKYKR